MGIVKVVWRCGDNMTADRFTKNLPEPLFEKHTSEYSGKDEYYKNRKRIKARVSSVS